MKKFFIIFVLILSFVSCEKSQPKKKTFNYPESKVWKHGVYSKHTAKELEGVFDGLEVDVIYSPEIDNIFIGRSIKDTVHKFYLDSWFAYLDEPSKMAFWVDFKNLTAENAEGAFVVLDTISKRYNIKDRMFVESRNVEALMIGKKKDFFTMLWVDNIYWSKLDTASLMQKIRSQIEYLQPDAISCEYRMFPLLCDTFPEQNIHFWDTPKKYTPENVEFTQKICRNKNVKAVLVDYPTPIDY